MPFIKYNNPPSDGNSSSEETDSIYQFKRYFIKSNGLSSAGSSNSDAIFVPFKRRGNIINFLEERSANEHKLRIRNVGKGLIEQTPIFVALNYFNSELGAKLIFSDIDSCELVKSWTNKDEQDVIVSFTKLGVRYKVYELRTRTKHALQKVCDELGPERIEIWKILFRAFGEGCLYTSLGKVALCRKGKRNAFLYISDIACYFYSTENYKFGEYYVGNKASNMIKM